MSNRSPDHRSRRTTPLVAARARAADLDAASPLREGRSRVFLPPDVVYLDGNSLGAMPLGVPERVAELVREEWGTGLVGSWNTAGWMDLVPRVAARLAPLIGCAPADVHVGETTSVLIFKLLVSAARLRPDRRAIVVEPGTFPTDRYVAQGVADLLGLELRTMEPAAVVAEGVGDDVAVVAMTHVDFRTGEMLDAPAITAAAHAAGALMMWDLCHSAGAVPVDLSAWGADLAVGCTYKYLNGGPGAPAYAWVAPALQSSVAQPITGWMGHAAPFEMTASFRPAPGVRRLASGTPPVLALSMVEAGLRAFEGIPVGSLRQVSLSLTDLFISLVDEHLGSDGSLEVVTPRDHSRRGSQVSLRHPASYAVVQALIARGVVGDFREPDIARFGFAPLYVTHADVVSAVEHLVAVLDGGEYDDPAYARRRFVT